jgi:hypothetical protein
MSRTCLALIILWNEHICQKYIVLKYRSTYAVFQLARKPSEPINRVSRGLTVFRYAYTVLSKHVATKVICFSDIYIVCEVQSLVWWPLFVTRDKVTFDWLKRETKIVLSGKFCWQFGDATDGRMGMIFSFLHLVRRTRGKCKHVLVNTSCWPYQRCNVMRSLSFCDVSVLTGNLKLLWLGKPWNVTPFRDTRVMQRQQLFNISCGGGSTA